MDPSNSLVEAVRENRADVVHTCLAADPTAVVATVDFLGHTLLHLAAMNGAYQVAALLLTMGAHVSAISKEGKTPLHFACQLGDLKMTDLFVSHRANLNATDAFQMTPLHLAVEKNHVDIVRLLCEQSGVDVNIADRQGRTCVAIANKRGNNCLLEILNKKLGGLQLDPGVWPSSKAALPSRPQIDSSMIPTNPFGKRKSYAKSIPVNCRANYPVIAPAAAPSDKVTTVKPSSSSSSPVVTNKNKVRIDVLDEESSSDEDTDFYFGGHRSREQHLSVKTKKRQLSFSPNTILDDTLYWLKRQALANSSSDLSSDFSLGGRELSLTEAGRLALKYMNENDSIQSEKSLFIKLAKSYEQESEEMATKSASNSSLSSTSGIDALVNALEDATTSTTCQEDQSQRSQLVRSDFFTGLTENLTESINVLNGLLNDSEMSETSRSEPLNLFNLNLLTDELNLDDDFL